MEWSERYIVVGIRLTTSSINFGVIVEHLLPLIKKSDNGCTLMYYPSSDFLTERCTCPTLTPKLRCKKYPIVGDFHDVHLLLHSDAKIAVQRISHRRKFLLALYLPHSNLKIAVQKIKGVHKDSLNFLIANSPETTYSAKRGLKRRGWRRSYSAGLMEEP